MSSAEKLRQRVILYVEDDVNIRKNAVEYLNYYCDNIYEAADGQEGYRKYKELNPDIIITDVKMPKLSGLELAQKIRQEDKTTLIIVITAHADTHLLLKAIELNLLKYLIKPVSESTLMPLLKDVAQMFEEGTSSIVKLGQEYVYDLLNKTLFCKKEYVKLNKKEQLFLDICMRNLHRVVTYEELEAAVWEGEMSEYALSSVVKSLRAKLPQKTLINISGTGYKIEL